MLKIRKVLVPVDFSKEAELALKWAVKLAKEGKGGRIFILHVLTPVPVFPEAGYDMGQVMEAQLSEAKKKLGKWQKKVPRSLKSTIICAEGNMSAAVKSICEKENIDLVLLTTHGRHGLSRVVHPNISEIVVREASCPVLVLHLNPSMKKKVSKS